MITIYGYSDDNLVIEDNGKCIDEIDCYDTEVKIWFSDGTIILCGYGKDHKGIWWIKIVEDGKAEHTLTVCDDEDADLYSDVFEIDAEYVKHIRGDESEDIADLRVMFEKLKEKYPIPYIKQAYEDVF